MQPAKRPTQRHHIGLFVTTELKRKLLDWQKRNNVPITSDAVRALVEAAIDLIDWEPAPSEAEASE